MLMWTSSPQLLIHCLWSRQGQKYFECYEQILKLALTQLKLNVCINLQFSNERLDLYVQALSTRVLTVTVLKLLSSFFSTQITIIYLRSAQP